MLTLHQIYSRHLTLIHLSLGQPYDVNTIIIPILQMRKVRHKEGKHGKVSLLLRDLGCLIRKSTRLTITEQYWVRTVCSILHLGLKIRKRQLSNACPEVLLLLSHSHKIHLCNKVHIKDFIIFIIMTLSVIHKFIISNK